MLPILPIKPKMWNILSEKCDIFYILSANAPGGIASSPKIVDKSQQKWHRPNIFPSHFFSHFMTKFIGNYFQHLLELEI
jgi:hypothetical protein